MIQRKSTFSVGFKYVLEGDWSFDRQLRFIILFLFYYSLYFILVRVL